MADRLSVEDYLPDPRFAASFVAIAGRWGTHAPRLLLQAELGERFGSPIQFELREAGPLAWVTVRRSHTGMNWYHYVRTDEGFAILDGPEALQAALIDAQVDVAKNTEHVMAAYEVLAYASAVRDPSVGEMLYHRPTPPADPVAFARIKPPAIERNQFVFGATIPWDSKLVRVRVQLDTRTVEEETLGRCVHVPAPMGRDYVGAEGPVRASLVEAPLAPFPLAPPAHARQALASAWRQAALAEHASVSSFSRAAIELMAVGAPLDLIRRTHEAAVDEIRHTQLAFAVAAALDGRSLAAGPLPALAPREPSLVSVAVDTLNEAAVAETLAAAEAAAAAEVAVDEGLREALRGIARDEGRHAALAWEIVGWSLGKLTEPERQRVLEGVRRPEPTPGPEVPAGHGILNDRERAEVAQSTWREQIEPRLAGLGLTPRPPLQLRGEGEEKKEKADIFV